MYSLADIHWAPCTSIEIASWIARRSNSIQTRPSEWGCASGRTPGATVSSWDIRSNLIEMNSGRTAGVSSKTYTLSLAYSPEVFTKWTLSRPDTRRVGSD